MTLLGQLRDLPKVLKLAVASFLLVLVFGYGSSFILLSDTTSFTPTGISENYLGNEDSEEEGPLKFRKSKYEMLSTVHTHAFSLAVLFLIMSLLIYMTNINKRLKSFLMIEPLLSIILTFGSLVLLWLGWPIFQYVAYASGALMHLSFALMVVIVAHELTQKPGKPTS